jgi:hypothetical protein
LRLPGQISPEANDGEAERVFEVVFVVRSHSFHPSVYFKIRHGFDSRWPKAKSNFGAVCVRFFQLGLEAARQGVHEAETRRTFHTAAIDCVGRKARASISHANFDVVTLSPSCDSKRSTPALEGVFLGISDKLVNDEADGRSLIQRFPRRANLNLHLYPVDKVGAGDVFNQGRKIVREIHVTR